MMIIFFSSLLTSAYAVPVCGSGGSSIEVCTIGAASVGNQVALRDITDMGNVTKQVSASFDKQVYGIHDTGTLTIVDPYANLTSSTIDKISSIVSSPSDSNGITLTLTETGPNTSTFVGNFSLTDGPSSGNTLHMHTGNIITAQYNPVPTYAPRFQGTFDNSGSAGNVTLSDYKPTRDDEINNGISIVIEPVNFTLANGASLDPVSGKIHVTLSYANAQFGCPIGVGGCGPNSLDVFVEPPNSSTFRGVKTNFGEPVIVDTVAKTVTADLKVTTTLHHHTSGSWIIALAYPGGIIGGGTGGVVGSPLVLDFISWGVSTGGSPFIVSPPSFGGGYYHYSDGLVLTQGKNTTTFDISQYNNEIPKQVLVSGQQVNMTFKTFESFNPEGMTHMGLYIMPKDVDMLTTSSLASIVWERDKSVEVHDQNHLLANATAYSDSDGKFQHTKYSFIPTKSYDKMSFLVRAWNDHLYSTDVRLYDAVDPTPIIKTLPAGMVMYDDFGKLQNALEKDRYYKPSVMRHIHSTDSVFGSTNSGKVYWLYDTINHTVALVISDNNDNVLALQKEALEPYEVEKKGDYKFMYFTVQQLNRWDEKQEHQAMELEADRAMSFALKNGLIPQRNW